MPGLAAGATVLHLVGSGMSDFIRDLHEYQEIRRLLYWMHRRYGLSYGGDETDGTWHFSVKEADYRVQYFMEFINDTEQKHLARFAAELRKEAAHKEAARLIGGPFDGEQIEVSTWGKTFSRKIRKAWWAVYKRRHGELGARFVGFATSESNAKHYVLAHATPAAEIKPMTPKINTAPKEDQ